MSASALRDKDVVRADEVVAPHDRGLQIHDIGRPGKARRAGKRHFLTRYRVSKTLFDTISRGRAPLTAKS